jgi:iron complex outermembrane receptor protein
LNESKYVSFANATCAPEANTSANCDYSGRTLPFAPRIIVNLGGDYRHPLSGGLEGHLFGGINYRSEANLSTTLSQYGYQSAYTTTDVGIGISNKAKQTELNLIAKNIADTQYSTATGDFTSSAGVSQTLGLRRSVSLIFKAKF